MRGQKLTASAVVVYAKQGKATEFALTQQKVTDSAAEGTPRRFHVELFIVHPTLDPAEITAALGMSRMWHTELATRAELQKVLFSQAIIETRDGAIASAMTSKINGLPEKSRNLWIASCRTKNILAKSGPLAEQRAS